MKALKSLAAALAIIAIAACAGHKADEAPPLTGPSGAATSISLSASPDSISHDGGSQSRITVTVLGPDGKPFSRPPTLRVDMFVNGVQQDYGTLSARTAVPNGNGEAILTYTSPPPPPGNLFGTCNGLAGTCVEILATPIGTNFEAAAPKSVLLRLVPPGVILPPAGTPTAAFTFSPQGPTMGVPVIFDASSSQAGSGGGQIARYAWSFGDGDTGTGMTPSHGYDAEGTVNVTLTVTNDRGLVASRSQQVTVGTAGLPTPLFTVSPAAPAVGQQVFFNASASTPGSGGAISSYRWTFGDGTTASGATTSHTYPAAGTYTVQLTVTDASGSSATSAGTSVAVSAPGGGTTVPAAATFTFSPAAPGVGETVFFNASTSTAGTAHTIASYGWTFGDGGSGTGVTVTHAYSTAGNYSIQLTITNEAGQSTVSAVQTVAAGSSSGPSASFTFSPTLPGVNDEVVFDASSSTTPQGTTITDVAWNFGDGTAVIHCPGNPVCITTNGTNRISAHTFIRPETDVVNLVVTDSAGRIGSRNINVTVDRAWPTVRITASPTSTNPGIAVNFNSNATTYWPGSGPAFFSWTFGDGGSCSTSAPGGCGLGTPANPTHTYAGIGSYTATLSVTDDRTCPVCTAGTPPQPGRTGIGSVGVSVVASTPPTAPTAAFTFSPPSPKVSDGTNTVSFDGSTSTPSAAITNYRWNFGDGTIISGAPAGVAPGPAPSTFLAPRHVFAQGVYNVTLTVTSPNGTGSTTGTVTVVP
jgi:PKD repeat protein